MQSVKEAVEGGAPLAVRRGGETRVFCGRGIKPALDALDCGALCGAEVGDKVVGAASAFILCEGKVASVWAQTISSRALQILESRGIVCKFREKTDRILNRAGDGLCPMESAVRGIGDPSEAVAALRAAYSAMTGK